MAAFTLLLYCHRFVTITAQNHPTQPHPYQHARYEPTSCDMQDWATGLENLKQRCFPLLGLKIL